MFVNLTEVKQYLNITWAESDTELWLILDWVESFVEWIIWDINLNEKTETIQLCLLDWDTFPLSNINIKSIASINWVDFSSKINWIDYLIRNNDTITVNNLSNYINNLNFDVFEVVYQSWYSEIPQDLKNAISELVWYYYDLDNWKVVSSEALWPRKVTFWNIENLSQKTNEALKVIKKYQVLNLKYFT